MFKRVIAALLALFAAAAFAAVDVNKASSAELDSVKGIGPAIATKIIDERKKGSFKDWTDFVDRVKGVGEGSAAKLSAEGLTVNGQSFSGAAAAPAKTPMKAAVKPEPDVAAAKPAKAEKADKATKAKADDKAAAPAAAADKASAPTKADKKAEKAEKAAAKKAEKAAAKADAASAAKK
jgi:competence protein ComEA